MQTKLQFFHHASWLYPKFQRGSQMAIKTTGYEMVHCTVVLCVTADGNKLPQHVILKKDSAQRCNRSGPTNTWMKSELMEDWFAFDKVRCGILDFYINYVYLSLSVT
jgi:hypothetical protein